MVRCQAPTFSLVYLCVFILLFRLMSTGHSSFRIQYFLSFLLIISFSSFAWYYFVWLPFDCSVVLLIIVSSYKYIVKYIKTCCRRCSAFQKAKIYHGRYFYKVMVVSLASKIRLRCMAEGSPIARKSIIRKLRRTFGKRNSPLSLFTFPRAKSL